jgi:hypothetical protein
VTAIQNGAADGNPWTTGDPAWTALIATPPYPDYSSGANGITAATTRALKNFFHRNHISFSITTTNTGPTTLDTRNFTRFSDVEEEVVSARVFLGIHFRFADEAARALGQRTADWAYGNYFRPVHHPWGHDHGDDDDDDDAGPDVKNPVP